MAESDWFDNQISSVGIPMGPKAKGPIFLDTDTPVVFKDKTTGQFYRLYVDSGALTIEEITL